MRNIKRWTIGAVLGAAVLVAVPSALADGTEELGPPTIAVASGTHAVVAGVGTWGQGYADRSDVFTVAVPAGATVKQVLAYWVGHATGHRPDICYAETPAFDNEIWVNGQPVTGTMIGGPTHFYWSEHYAAFRADITALGLVGAGSSTLTISKMHFKSCFPYTTPDTDGNDGAGVLVIYDDGSASSAIVDVRDGLDLAYKHLPPGMPETLRTTVPQTFEFAPSTTVRTATLATLAGSVKGPTPSEYTGDRGNILRVTFDVGDPVELVNVWQANQGHDFDALNQEITIPANASRVTVQALSEGPDWPHLPASLAWIGAALSVDVDPPGEEPPPQVEARTIGFWKNWSSCTNGNQTPVLEQTLAATGGIALGSNLTVTTCVAARNILDKSTADTGKKRANDPAFNLAAQLLAARLNVARNAGLCSAAAEAITAAHNLLSSVSFTGTEAWVNTMTSAQRSQANALATTLDSYNNNNNKLC